MFKGFRVRILLEYLNREVSHWLLQIYFTLFLVLSLPHFLMQKGFHSVHTGVPDIQQQDTVTCQLHSAWHHLLHITAIKCTDRLCRRNSLWEFSLRHVKATKQHFSCIYLGEVHLYKESEISDLEHVNNYILLLCIQSILQYMYIVHLLLT